MLTIEPKCVFLNVIVICMLIILRIDVLRLVLNILHFMLTMFLIFASLIALLLIMLIKAIEVVFFNVLKLAYIDKIQQEHVLVHASILNKHMLITSLAIAN